MLLPSAVIVATPEESAWEAIGGLLEVLGWQLQDRSLLNLPGQIRSQGGTCGMSARKVR